MFVTFFRRFSLLKDGGNSRCIVIFLTKDPQLNTKTRFQYNYKKPPNITVNHMTSEYIGQQQCKDSATL